MAIRNVSNGQQLVTALKSAAGGDKIVLAAGNYGNVSVTGLDYKGGSVTVSGAGKATFTGFALHTAKNLTLDGIVFDYVAGKSATPERPFTVTAATNVTIRNSDFDGHLAGGYGTSLGLRVMDSTGIVVENSDFTKFQRGVYFTKVTNLVVRGNDLTMMSEDGLEFAQVIDARIERNHVYDMHTPAARGHKDLIQFWSAGTTKPSANVVIQGNVLESDETMTHGIYVGNEIGRTNKSFKYQNIQIIDNKVLSGHVMGIDVEHANKVTIRGNEVRIHPEVPKKPINTPIIEVTPDSTAVVISGNITHGLPDQYGTGWTVTSNRIVTTSGTVSTGITTDSDTGSGGGTPSGGDTFRFVGSQSKGDTDTLRDFDFADGDRIILQDYAAGTLKGIGGGNPLAVNQAGTYAVLDSAADLRELDQASSAVTLASKNGGLVLSITQPGGRHDINLPAAAAKVAATTASTATAAAKTAAPAADGGSNFSFTMAASDRTTVLAGLDFADGDRILLKSFPGGTLKGSAGGNPLAVSKDGTSAVLDSLADLRELDLASAAVSTRTLAKNDVLVLDIDPSGPGSLELHLQGHGQDFLAR